jgi:hypothetical protein
VGLVVAVEDWLGTGSAGAAAGLLPDGRVFVFGDLFDGRADAFAWAGYLVETHPGTRLVVGASLVDDESIPAGVEATTAGAVETKAALSLWRERVRDRRLVHDDGEAMTAQLAGVRVAGRAGGLVLSNRSGRSDLVRAAAWATAEAVRSPAPLEFFVY